MTEKEQLYIAAKGAYYRGKPIMSDVNFDALEIELEAIGSDVINLVGSDDGLVNNRFKGEHLTPVLSLSKISADKDNNPPVAEFIKWVNKIGKPHMLEVTPKYDGNSGVLHYEDGKFKRALTRGDGKIGQDITNKVERLVPLEINMTELCEVKGEFVMPLDVFEVKYNEFKNPRNLVAGILAHKTNNISMIDDMHFIPYEVKYQTDIGKFRHVTNIASFFIKNKFKRPYTEFLMLNNPVDAFKEMYTTMQQYRNASNYQLDGFVMKVISSNVREALGTNDHDPNWAISCKFQAKKAITKILDIEWIMSKQGNLTPVAHLEPIDIDGSVISKCSLYNYGTVVNEKLFPGAIVIIEKKGDIIPAITEIIKPAEINYIIPIECPHCGTTLNNDSIRLFCPNTNCNGLSFKKFKDAVGLLELDFFGESTLDKIFNTGIENIIDFLNPELFNEKYLTRKQLFKYGKTLDRLIHQHSLIKEIPLWKVILMQGINGLGKTVSVQLSRMVNGQDYTTYGLQKEFFEMFKKDMPARILLQNNIEQLLKFDINVNFEIDVNKTEEIKNMVIPIYRIEMTGSPKNFGFPTKDFFIKEAAIYGIVEQVKLKNADYLITDDYESESSKMKEAVKLKKEILTYSDFISKIRK